MPCPLLPCGVGPVVVLLAPPRLCGAMCSTEIWYGWCSLLAVMSSLRARYHTKYDCPCFDAVLRSCEEALAEIILHRPPSLWFAWVRWCGTAGSRGGPGGGGGPGARAGRGPGAYHFGGEGGGPGLESTFRYRHPAFYYLGTWTLRGGLLHLRVVRIPKP